jgi:hypothetical protein
MGRGGTPLLRTRKVETINSNLDSTLPEPDNLIKEPDKAKSIKKKWRRKREISDALAWVLAPISSLRFVRPSGRVTKKRIF